VELSYCPRCRASIVPGLQYCYQCGSDLQQVAATARAIELAPGWEAPPRPPVPIATEGPAVAQLDPLERRRAMEAYTTGLKHLGHGRAKSARVHIERAVSLAPGEPHFARALAEAGSRRPVSSRAAGVGLSRLASPARKTGALALDLLLYLLLAAGAAALLDAAWPDAQTSREEDVEAVVAASVVLALYIGYFWAGFALGQTAGGKAAGCRVVEKWNLGRPGPWRGLVRAAASLVSWPLLFAGWLWGIWDAEGQTWHDKIAGTYVLDARSRADLGNRAP
jgi:uncharacterized RDD family membrane protein YckC